MRDAIPRRLGAWVALSACSSGQSGRHAPVRAFMIASSGDRPDALRSEMSQPCASAEAKGRVAALAGATCSNTYVTMLTSSSAPPTSAMIRFLRNSGMWIAPERSQRTLTVSAARKSSRQPHSSNVSARASPSSASGVVFAAESVGIDHSAKGISGSVGASP